MSDTACCLLTPPGAGAIATVGVVGPRALEVTRSLFTPARGPLTDAPGRVWFGTFGGDITDEVVVAVKSADRVEVHCHGGVTNTESVLTQIEENGCRRAVWSEWLTDRFQAMAVAELAKASTVRTASILLDQYYGAFAAAVGSPENAAELKRLAPLGRHLVAPWRVAVAGPPNVGKSSLLNAVAGYRRSVVADVPGTTRDLVSVTVALDGWPFELTDTAGLRDAGDDIERLGVSLAESSLRDADLAVWVIDAAAEPVPPPAGFAGLAVVNKIDLPPAWPASRFPDAVRLSAKTGDGVPGLIAAIVDRLVPEVSPGAAVPFTPELADDADA